MTRDVASRELRPIEVIRVAGSMASDVWLRKGIEHTTIIGEQGEEEEVWVASDVIHGIVDGLKTPQELEDQFDELWARFEDESLTDAERIADARDTAYTNSDAIAELGDMVAEGEVTMEDLSQAIIELAEIIGGGE